jgi:hypothetical protein
MRDDLELEVETKTALKEFETEHTRRAIVKI